MFNVTDDRKTLTMGMGPDYSYEYDNVLPAKEGTFMNMNIALPRNVEYVLKETYGNEVFTVCRSNRNFHRNASHIIEKDINCKHLKRLFTFSHLPDQ